ncbi:MAG: hypothetical protein COA74_06190 [Gammaproteobacteria bacterium]|nr:MAG: hypothetical protein COA74_14170 [Gammaproteobacteria bacterium]PCJ49151.1 MAG: hypothetical protein COA74_06190 [Gammaproteobacteria bacterium]
MKTKLLAVIWGAVLSSSLLVPDTLLAGASANVAMTNDYRFRGISQNDKSFALQGGFDYQDTSGFYAGVWSSSVDFQIQTVDDASTELDIYAGWGGEFKDSGLSWDIGFLHYNYPAADSSLRYNFTEVNSTVSYQWLTVFYAHTNDYFAGSGTADYINISAGFELQDDWSVGVSLGHQAVENNSAWGAPDWNDYKIYVAKSYEGFDFELAFIDTDLKNSECFGGSDWCAGTVTLAISKSFE